MEAFTIPDLGEMLSDIDEKDLSDDQKKLNKEKAYQLHYQLLDLINLLFEEGNPVGIKALLELSGLCSKQVRLPLISATSTLFDRMEQVIEQSIYAY